MRYDIQKQNGVAFGHNVQKRKSVYEKVFKKTVCFIIKEVEKYSMKEELMHQEEIMKSNREYKKFYQWIRNNKNTYFKHLLCSFRLLV